jgi:uncharacterized protein YgiM (DUF1202 family)
MKRNTRVLLILLIFALLLAGCGFIEGAEGEGEHRERLDPAEWPTPEPNNPIPTPTLFTQVTLAPAALPTPAVTPEATATPAGAAAATVAAPAAEETPVRPSGSELVTLIQNLSGGSSLPSGLTPVGVSIVMADGLAVRREPRDSSGVVETLEKGELAGVLGKDSSGSWVYVITLRKTLGWLPLEALRITGNLAEVPVLPPNPLGALISSLSSSGTGGPAVNNKPAVQPVAVADLNPITTAQVKSELLNVRQRPGATYNVLYTLAEGDEVSVLALNRDKEWALIKTGDERVGWASVDFLTFNGSLANAPQVRSLEPTSANEVAPIAVLSASAGAGEAAVTGSPTSSAAAPAAAPAAVTVPTGQSETPTLPSAALAPVASAQVKVKFDSRRGPDDSYGAVDELTVDEPVEILAQNEQKDWVVVRTPNGSVGWAPLENLAVEGSLTNTPAVLTAWVESNETKLRSGPGIYYDEIGVLAIYDMISVLGLNEGRNWALIEALNGGQGWIPLRFIEVAGSLANVPEVAAPALTESKPADPSLPVPNAASATTGKLVFQTASGGDIMVINADGTGLRRLTNGIDPVLSADGQQVAFTRWEGEVGTLWVINADGTGERAILGEMAKAKGPDWSPDGSQIVLNFQHGGHPEERDICRPLDSSSTPPRNATNIRVRTDERGIPTDLCWTLLPDPNWSLRVVNVADGQFEDLYGGLYAFRPAWDPSQSWRIVSDAGNGLLAVDVNRAEYTQQLTDVVGDSSPVFSPDGRFLVVTTQLQNGYDIFRMNNDGSGRVRLTETPLWEPVQADSEGKLWNNVAPVWSPDGSSIVFLTDRTGRWEIWVMNADGSNQRPMFSEEITNQLKIGYDFVDERVLSWR